MRRTPMRLFGATMSALLASSALVAPARAAAPPLFTSTWLGARGVAGSTAAANAASATIAATPASIASVQRAMANLRQAAQALAAAGAAQTQAREAALSMSSTVANGLAPGGLVPIPNAVAGFPGWIGANLPAQSVSAGQTSVTIRQTSAQALLYWRQFNVGRNTTLNFDQSAGGSAANTWVAVNEVNDPSANPTQILGSITAPGQVYIINPNGIIFGATAQVNVGSLLASTAVINGGDAQFLQTGIYGPTRVNSNGSAEVSPSFTGASGAIEVDAGAQITTNPASSPLSTGGSVLLLGQSVQNAGSIVTANGQTALAAGADFTIQPGYSVSSAGGGSAGNATSTVRGDEIAVTSGGPVGNSGVISASTGDISLVGGTVAQLGVAVSTTSTVQRGTIHLLTDTADADASVILGPGSTTAITLDPNSGEALDSQRAGAIAASASADAARIVQAASGDLLNDQVVLPDRQDLSRIEITTGGLVDFQAGSLTLATGGQVAVSARYIPPAADPVTAKESTGRIFVADGAVIDVSGANGATLPAAANSVAVNVQGFELRDAPANRDTGSLSSQTVYVDQQVLVPVAASAAYATPRLYTPGGLLEVSGEVGNIDHGIGEFDAPGGTITLSAAQVIAQPGADFNIAGGSVAYQAGYVPTSWLIGNDGRLYDVNTAPADVVYAGVFDGFSEQHARWDITATYANALIAPSQTYEAGHTVGRDAGELLLSTPTALFQGEIDAGVTVGQRQDAAAASGVSDPYLQAQAAVPRPGTLALGDFDARANVFPTDVTIGATADTSASTLTATTPLGSGVIDTAYLAAPALNGFGLGGLAITVGATPTTTPKGVTVPTKGGSITLAAELIMAPGGTVTLSGGSISVQAPIVARDGAVDLSTQATIYTVSPTTPIALSDAGVTAITLGAGAAIDTRGLWTNASAGGDLAGAAYVDGGAVTIDSAATLDLAQGSAIDASAGAALLPGGRQMGGRGGDITLIGDDPLSFATLPQPKSAAKANQADFGPVTVAAALSSLGVTQGGAFTLEVPLVAIGDGLRPGSRDQVVLSPGFFESGFSAYTINAFGNGESIEPPNTGDNLTDRYVNLASAAVPALTVAPDTQIVVAEPIYQFSAASQLVPTGSDPSSALLLTLLPDYVIDPTRATIAQRPGASIAFESIMGQSGTYTNGSAIDIGAGSLIQVDAGQSIRVESYSQLTVDGTLRAPGGTISLLNDRQEGKGASGVTYVPGLSVWVGATATLDAAARPAVAEDVFGHPFGLVPSGGTIVIGAVSSAGQTADPVIATDAAVIIRPGALLDVSGTSAATDPAAGLGTLSTVASAPTLVASNAGTISLSSYSGIYPDGTMRAFGGGPSAEGGMLDITLETPLYAGTTIPGVLLEPHEVIVGQQASQVLPADLTPADPATFSGAADSLVNKAMLGVDQITSAGFTQLSIYTHDVALFQGDVSLHLAQSISLQAAAVVDSSRTGTVDISAPYLLLGSPVQESGANYLVVNYGTGALDSLSGAHGFAFSSLPSCGGASLACISATLDLSGDLIDLQNTLRFAVDTTIDPAASTLDIVQGHRITVDLPGFADVNLTSSGDIRFLASAANGASVAASGDVTLTAAQVYPVTPATQSNIADSVDAGVTVVTSGATSSLEVSPKSVLTIARSTGTVPAAPLSTFGTIEFGAATIDQGGIVRAPEGQISFGGTPFDRTITTRTLASGRTIESGGAVALVELLPGSITSVSADGLTIPFGGTTNGTQYTYNGSSVVNVGTEIGVAFTLLYGVSPLSQISTTGITADVVSLTIAPGAIVDLSGGGTLSGGGGEYLSTAGGSPTLLSQGFITGRGGSTDTLVTPLGASAATAPVLQTGSASSGDTVAVFAVLPGLASGYAPVTGFDQASTYYGSLPSAGEQVTLRSATGGLPAGTYTLLPSYYALLPGAYRVQFGQASVTATTPLGSLDNGSFVGAGYVGVANTPVRTSLPVAVTVTPGSVVGTYSQYDQENYAQFITSVVTQFGDVRPALPQDAKTLLLDFFTPVQFQAALPALVDAGTVLFGPASGGYGGTAVVTAGTNGDQLDLEVTAGLFHTRGFDGVSVAAEQVDRLGAADLRLGSSDSNDAVGTIVIRAGAVLSAPEIDVPSFGQTGPTLIAIEPGATLSTLGEGPAPVIPSRGAYPAVGSTAAADMGDGIFLSNSGLTLDPVATLDGSIELGACIGAKDCGSLPVGLLSDGALIIAGDASINGPVRFGAQAFTAFVPTLTLASPTSRVPKGGFTLTEGDVAALIAGAPSLGLPALQQLTLDAADVNILGPFSLDTINAATGQSSLAQLVLQTPVINGKGAPGDVATITTGTFIWVGQPVVTPIATGTGSGTLDVVANQIVLGYPAGSPAAGNTPVDRTIGGFSLVSLTASGEVTSTNDGTLTVYQSPGTYVNGSGFVGAGGTLDITTPLLTGGPGAVLAIVSAGPLTLQAPAGVAPSTATAGALGAELDLTAPSIADDTAIVLPAGRLTMTAQTGDIGLGAASRLVLPGLATTLIDQTGYTPGGTVSLQSASGNVTQAPGALIDVAAVGADAGTLSVAAMGRTMGKGGGISGGTISLLGTLLGSGGSGDAGGSIDIRAATLTQDGFVTLNQQLNAGGFGGSRAFEVATGSLTIGADPASGGALLQAHTIDVSVDAGSLQVTGLIDASGAAPGVIRLASSGNLVLAASAVLDAHGTAPQVDLTGLTVDALNAGSVELAVSGGANGANLVTGTLMLQPGATIDVSAAPGVTCSYGACGDVELDAPRVGSAGSGSVAISAPTGVTVLGAGSIDVNAFWNYAPATGIVVQDNLNAHGKVIDKGALGLDQANQDSAAFIAAAEPNGTLGAAMQSELGGLAADTTAFHLRPGVEIVSRTATGGLTVDGDLDLSQYRYASVNPDSQRTAVYGSGEPGVLVLRAGGDLTITGSINDGFGQATPLRTPDDRGWVLLSRHALPGSVVVPPSLPRPIVLESGTKFPTDGTLSYDIHISGVVLAAGEAVPDLLARSQATLRNTVTVQTAFVATGSVTPPGGRAFRAGATIPAGTVLKPGTVLGAGATLPQDAPLMPLTWPAGASLAALARAPVLASPLRVAPGDRLPAGLVPVLSKRSVDLRPVVGKSQGVVYGALPMLPSRPGSPTLSWSLRLVAGADTAAADTRALQPGAALQAQAGAADPSPGSVVLSDLHYSIQGLRASHNTPTLPTETFSVIRTGTGYLDVLAGGNVDEETLYGVYTAGSNVADVASAYDLPRQDVFPATKRAPASVLGKTGTQALGAGPSYEALVASGSPDDVYQASYPEGGGDLLVSAQGDIAGDVVSYQDSANPAVPDSDAVGSWLWRQGGNGVSTAWWINFGTYATFQTTAGEGDISTALIGFTGFGALGGGNVTVAAGGDAGYGQGGVVAFVNDGTIHYATGTGLDIAVASTGRVDPATGDVTYTGGGALTLAVAGALNATQSQIQQSAGLYGTLTDLRGDITVSAGSIGAIPAASVSGAVSDPRALPPDANEEATALGGPVLVPGDGTATLYARGDLVLTGVGDATRETEADTAAAATGASPAPSGLQESWFSLWQPATAITLDSAGGNVAPIVEPSVSNVSGSLDPNGNATATDYRYVYPPILQVSAQSGSIYVQRLQPSTESYFAAALETAPAADGFIDFLAAQSIYGNAATNSNPNQSLSIQQNIPVDISGADPADLPDPQAPAWRLFTGKRSGSTGANAFTSNLGADAHNVATDNETDSDGLPLFAFEADTASPTTHAGSPTLSRFYAVAGDVVDLQVGEVLTFASPAESPAIWQIGGEAARIIAGRDVVESGITPAASGLLAPDITGVLASTSEHFATPSGDLIVDANTSDASEFAAGRDILYLNADISGPGSLLVQAGRDLYQADQGVIQSLGAVDRNAASASGGASITVLAGSGVAGPDYAAFAELYFDPDNLANPVTPLQDQPGKVPETYQDQLLSFLQQSYGYSGSAAGALPFFLGLSPVEQGALVLPIFYGELNQAGLNYNDPSSRFYHTYLRGNLAIASLLPLYGSTGYDGAVTLFGGSGIRTDYGGSIQMLVPGGDISLGIEAAVAPPATAGVITQGSGDIDIYSEGSVLLGQSRVLTTYGGSILIWSRQGDINAGIGSKSTVLSTPVGIAYDRYGDVTLSPTVPSTGAGIGSLAPIPSVPPGDVNLIAPEGTIDAGEAGIRSSGNANLAALAVVNAANIQVKGSTTGVPTVQAPNLGALAAASAVAGAQQQAATAAAQPRQSDSIITVEVIGFGG